jgi:myo-inositol-1(or 4)-monophosphatase
LPEPDATSRDAELLFDAVRQAGLLAMTMLRQTVRRWSKSDGSPVTEADLKVDALLAGTLRARRPGYGWLSEESQDDLTRTEHPMSWIVDPIDGTKSFAQGGGNWCVAAALVDRGRPVAAAIYRPATEEYYTAIRGRGAQLNGAPLAASATAYLSGAAMIGTRKSLETLLPLGIMPDYSGDLPLQLRLAHVASGRAEGAVSIGHKNDWDLAAGDLLVHEAGGRVSDLNGLDFIYNRKQTWQNGMIAAGQQRHPVILKSLGTA